MDLRSGLPEPSAPSPTALSWRVSRQLTWVKGLAAAAFVLIAVVSWPDRTETFAALVGVALMGAYALRDLVAPVRLAADADGVTVISGYAGRRRLAWSEIERVRVDRRTRLGLRSEMLEIDAGESLFLFSTYDLNAPCADVEEALHQLRR
jgi:hypothetical protein